MQTIKIQCPAKINLNLKITGKLENGFHAIESIMQTISLYDYLTIEVDDSDKNEITLSGNCSQIPYDETNLVYKAAKLYLETTGIKNKKVNIYIEKNIPVAAGLAGGSTDAAGTLYGLDKLLPSPEFLNSLRSLTNSTLSHSNDAAGESYLDFLCAKLGSDLNVCLHGGRILAQGRGEIITPLEFEEFCVSLIKPVNLGISAKEAYTKFSQKNKPYSTLRNTLPVQGVNHFVNDLEWAIIDDYPQLQYIKQKYPKSVMTGSGSTYFIINDEFAPETDYWIKNNLKSIDFGVKKVN